MPWVSEWTYPLISFCYVYRWGYLILQETESIENGVYIIETVYLGVIVGVRELFVMWFVAPWPVHCKRKSQKATDIFSPDLTISETLVQSQIMTERRIAVTRPGDDRHLDITERIYSSSASFCILFYVYGWFLIFFIFCIWIFSLHVCLCTTCIQYTEAREESGRKHC